MTTTFSFLGPLSRTDRDKEIEILVLRHQLMALQRQVAKPVFMRVDRLLLAGLLHRLPKDKLRRLVLPVRPDTVLHGTAICCGAVTPQPVRLAGADVRVPSSPFDRWCCGWHGRIAHGVTGAFTVSRPRSVSKSPPLPSGRSSKRTASTRLPSGPLQPGPRSWAAFLRSQAGASLACFFEVRTLTGARPYVLTATEHATRRIRVLGVTTNPTGQWATQLDRNLVIDLQDVDPTARFLIRDRDAKFTATFDAVSADAGTCLVKSGVRTPRMNSIMERWIQTCQLELLDRTLIWKERHLLHAPREFETFYNEHRPHRALRQAAPPRSLPNPDTGPTGIVPLDVRRHDRLGGVLKEYRHVT
ncbi:integrase core domain-containing protein [Nonomuraea antimicrobica]